MLLKEYLCQEDQKRRILLISNMNNSQKIARLIEEETGAIIRNTELQNLRMIAEQILKYEQSAKGFEIGYEMPDSIEAQMIFRSILFDNIDKLQFFNEENMLSFTNTKEIFGKVNVIRGNGWNGREEEEKDARIEDLKFLIEKYEQYLLDNNMLDQEALYKHVIEFVDSMNDPKEELKGIFDAEITYLKDDVESFNGLQFRLLEKLKCRPEEGIDLVESYPIDVSSVISRDKVVFFKGYGSFNEASFVANDIIKNNIPFGKVTVLYNSSSNYTAIQAAFTGNGIKMSSLSDSPIYDNGYVGLAYRIFDWALDDYSEKALDKVLLSPVLSLSIEDEDGNEKDLLASQNYYGYVRNARERWDDRFNLGWGYERNVEFVKQERKSASDANDEAGKAVIDMHDTLLGIFGENGKEYDDTNKVRPFIICEKLLQFVKEYTKPSQAYAVGVAAIENAKNALRFEERCLTFQESIDCIKNLIGEASDSDEEMADAVSVMRLGSFNVLERPYVYIIGLSLNEMQGKTIESPVLSDSEMVELLDGGYKPTIKNDLMLKEGNIKRTLSTFRGEKIAFGYSFFDTVNSRATSPSSLYREMIAAFGVKEEDVCEFVYGNPHENEVKYDLDAFLDGKVGDYEIKLSTSSSKLEELLGCPKKFAYQRVLYVPENTFLEKNNTVWLNAPTKGTFFHELSEKYIKENLIRPAKETYTEDFDENPIRDKAKELEEKILREYPAPFKEIADEETKKLEDAAISYFKRLVSELISEKWRVLEVEQKFVDAKYTVNTYNNRQYDFVITGYIDRIDYKADYDEKKVFIRVVDYKTGKKKYKESSDSLGMLIQYAIYVKAVMEIGKFTDDEGDEVKLLDCIKKKVASLEENESIADWDFEFDSFCYTLPLETYDDVYYYIPKDMLEGINIVRLKAILTIIQDKKIFPDHKELFEEIDYLIGKYPSNEDELSKLKLAIADEKDSDKISWMELSNCRNCKYNALCTHKKAGEFDD